MQLHSQHFHCHYFFRYLVAISLLPGLHFLVPFLTAAIARNVPSFWPQSLFSCVESSLATGSVPNARSWRASAFM